MGVVAASVAAASAVRFRWPPGRSGTWP